MSKSDVKIETPWRTVEEIAEYLGTSVRHVRSLVKGEGFPCSRLGRLMRFHVVKVDEWLKGREVRVGGLDVVSESGRSEGGVWELE